MKTKRPILLRWPQRLVRAAAWAVLLTFSANIVTPTLVMARESERRAELMAGPKRTPSDDVTDTLIQLEEALQRMNRRLQGGWEFEWQEIANRGGQTPPPAVADRAALRALEDELDAAVPRLESLQGHVRAFFAQTRKHIQDANLAPEILARHDDSVGEYEASYGQLKALLHAIRTAHTLDEFKAAVAAGDAFMQAHSSKPKRSTFDPNAPLAFGPGKNKAPEPRTDAKALRKALGIAEPTAKMLARQADPKAAPTAAELAETEDAQFTAAIRAKAQELGNNPVAIYNFVRNNVEFMPTYGSIQGADQTLKTLRGNAFDQSSLLIALLRAANIPARYVYGTIELPIEQVQNWVGGTETPQAALELLGQGGIPNLGLTQGGVIKKARIEHVWVEAFVDFVPSRGVKNRAGDAWVPLDASFKQFVFTPGMDLASQVQFDGNALLEQIDGAAQLDPITGAITGFDASIVSAEVARVESQIRQIRQQADPDATVEEMIGTKRIQTVSVATLSSMLPYSAVTPQRLAVLPDAIRWKFRFTLDGNVMLSRSLPALGSTSLALSFKPATEADEAALRSLIPANADGPEDYPSTISTSLFKVVPEFTIDGVVVATGNARQLGADLTTTKGLYIPAVGWQETDNPLTAGDYHAIGVDVGGISRAHYERLHQQLVATKAKLETQSVDGLTRHDVTGAILQAGIASYFVQTLRKAEVAAQAGGLIFYRLPSYGTLSTHSQVQYWFGMPRSFVPKGAVIDMDRMASIAVSKDGSHAKWIGFNKSIGGVLSSHEHSVLEDLFENDQIAPTGPSGVSAAKALSLAASQGQRLFHINNSNLNAALSTISLSADVEREIADAVMNGKTVTTHERLIQHAGISTAGYVIADNETGSAAYKIATSEDGGVVLILLGVALAIAALLFVVNPVLGILMLAGALLLVGCGLSMLTGDSRWMDGYMLLAMGLIGALLTAASAGTITAFVIPALMELALIISNVANLCAAGFPSPAKR